MITQKRFEAEIRRLKIDPDPLGGLISDPVSASQFVVAGPGTGKTTALAIRTLKLILVDDVDPGAIMATTFTRRAAKELRSRILQTADLVRRALLTQATAAEQRTLGRLDFNRVYTGTLDGLSEEIMTDFRGLGTAPPVVIDQYVADALMLFRGLFSQGRFRRRELGNYYGAINGTRWGMSPKALAGFVREIHERALYQGVDLDAYRNSGLNPGIPVVVDAIRDYRGALTSRNQYDFALLEDLFLQRLSGGNLQAFTRDIRVLLVDEYQDTNFLQERIYFEIARCCIAQGGGVTVVGDDDQALYRFRGATTNLFINFPSRIRSALGVRPSRIDLSENRRSADPIVKFVNRYVGLDPEYRHLRVKRKPPLETIRTKATKFPILGLFRDDLVQLTTDLTDLIDRVVNGRGFRISGTKFWIRRDAREGSAADIILLSPSPLEENGTGRALLPQTLRTALGNLRHPIEVYNPRGRAIDSVPQVAELLGMALECIDPGGQQAQAIGNLPTEATNEFTRWRVAGRALINRNPTPHGPPSLRNFVRAWAQRTPTRGGAWPKEDQPLLQVIYKLVTWIPFFQDDLEGLSYLEALNRTAVSAANLGNYEGELSFASPQDFARSVKELYWNFFAPMAMDLIEVDEDLLDTLPTDRLGIFSIHQAKGLQFPLVIVDVGSNFRNDNWAQAFKRFPRDGGRTGRLEDDLGRFAELGRPGRSALDRAFDDLVRQYFVAYSRAQDVLLLVGLTPMTVNPAVPHIATGWRRDRSWPWRGLPNVVMI